MATLTIRKPHEVPARQTPISERQEQYAGFVRAIGTGQVGELQLLEGEEMRGEKVRLRRASTRLGIQLEIWDDDDRIYFEIFRRQLRPS